VPTSCDDVANAVRENASEHSRAFNKRFSPIARFQHLIASPFN